MLENQSNDKLADIKKAVELHSEYGHIPDPDKRDSLIEGIIIKCFKENMNLAIKLIRKYGAKLPESSLQKVFSAFIKNDHKLRGQALSLTHYDLKSWLRKNEFDYGNSTPAITLEAILKVSLANIQEPNEIIEGPVYEIRQLFSFAKERLNWAQIEKADFQKLFQILYSYFVLHLDGINLPAREFESLIEDYKNDLQPEFLAKAKRALVDYKSNLTQGVEEKIPLS